MASEHITIYLRCENDLVGRICHDTMTTHGTKSAYNRGCRCDACREASRLARSRQRENARRREQTHAVGEPEPASAVPLQHARSVKVEVLERHESAFGNGQTARTEQFSNGLSPRPELSSSNGTFVRAEAAPSPAPVTGDGVPENTPLITAQHITPEESHAPAPKILEESTGQTMQGPAPDDAADASDAAENVAAQQGEEVAADPVEEDEVDDASAGNTEMSPSEAMDAVESFVDAFDGVWNEVSGLLDRNTPEPETHDPVPQDEPITSFPLVDVQVRSSLLPPPPVPTLPPPVPSPVPSTERREPAIDEPRSSEEPVTENASETLQDNSPAASASSGKLRSLFGGRRRASRDSGEDSGS